MSLLRALRANVKENRAERAQQERDAEPATGIRVFDWTSALHLIRRRAGNYLREISASE